MYFCSLSLCRINYCWSGLLFKRQIYEVTVTGTALCRGDSGGGLAFAGRVLSVNRFYLRGIASTAPRSKEKMCNENTYILFTKITKHRELIDRYI